MQSACLPPRKHCWRLMSEFGEASISLAWGRSVHGQGVSVYQRVSWFGDVGLRQLLLLLSIRLTAAISCHRQWNPFPYVSGRFSLLSRRATALVTCAAWDSLCFVIVCGGLSSDPLELSVWSLCCLAWSGALVGCADWHLSGAPALRGGPRGSPRLLGNARPGQRAAPFLGWGGLQAP